jgi:solute carrier family 25 folate transporter 32
MNPSLVHCGSAVLAGGVSDLICNPMFVVRTRLQTESLHHLVETGAKKMVNLGMIRTAMTLYQEGGVLAFWRGLTASLMGLSHVAIQFPVYEKCVNAYTGDRQNCRRRDTHTGVFACLLLE